MSVVICLFARCPIVGRVKTRLIPALGAERAAALHSWLAGDALRRYREIAEVELWTDSPCDAWPDFTGPRRLQPAGDLGARMRTALDGRHAMIVGSDAPGVPLPHLERLIESEADVAIGPSNDGGYYAIAARRIEAAMFAGVEWSSGRELAQTVAACRAAGLSVSIGDEWFDIDTQDDLTRAVAEGLVPCKFLPEPGFQAE